METCDDEYSLATLGQSKTGQTNHSMRQSIPQILEFFYNIRDSRFLRLFFSKVPFQKSCYIFEENPRYFSVSQKAKNM